jgi:hypothetical protein
MVAAAVAACTLAGAAEAQPRWGRPQVPRDGACFYRDKNFDGDYFCARAGENIPSMPSGLNDQISSIRTFGNAEVTVFRDVRFRGRSETFNGNVRNLREEGWNDLLSSIRVDRRGGFSGGRSGGGFADRADADRIIRRAYQDILNREPDQEGLRHYRSLIIDDRWTEADVRNALRSSPEFRQRNQMTRERAQEIVARAYRSVLGRDPDPGAEAYVQRVLRDRWTEQDVERELRRSDEYRQNNRARPRR